LTIGSIVFRDARLRYEDRQQGATYEISDWNLSSGAVRLGEPVDLETGLDLTATNPDFAGRIEARGRLTPGAEKVTLQRPEFSVVLSGAPAEGVTRVELSVAAQLFEVAAAGPFSLSSPEIRLSAAGDALPDGVEAVVSAERLSGDLAAETLSLTALEAAALGITVTGEVQGEKVLSGPRLSGNVEIREFSPKAVADRAGVPLTPTIDPEALTRLALSGRFSSTPTSVRFEDVVLVLDDTTLEGTLAVADFERQAVRFDLSADRMTLDRYMAPASEEPAAAENAGGEAAIPAEEIRGLDVDGTLRIHPSRADMYGGTYEGDIRIDASGEVPTLSLDEKLKGVDFGALGADVFDNRQLTGALDGRITLTGKGVTQSAILATLAGDAVFAFQDGAILGVDIPYELQRGLSLIGKGSAPAGSPSGRTEFAELSGSADVEAGVVRNDDLIVRLPFMLGTGQGTVDLKDDSLRYRLELQFQKSPELPTAASEFVGYSFPVLVKGTLGEPALDLGDMAAALARKAAEDRVEQEVEKARERVLGEAGKALGGLFGGGSGDKEGDGGDAEAEPSGEKQDEEKKEDPLGDALRGLRKKIDE
jgi:AsmA protein